MVKHTRKYIMDITYVEEELDLKHKMEIKKEDITEQTQQRMHINKRKGDEIRSEESKKLKSEEYCIMCQEFGHSIISDCIICFKCGIKGHSKRDCPTNQVPIQPKIDTKVTSQLETNGSSDYIFIPSENRQMSKTDRDEIIHECTEDLVCPSDLAKKWNCNPDTIRTLVRKARKTLPKQYRKSIYRDKPKPPMSAFYFFMREEGREKATKENPNATKKEIGKFVGEIWSKLKDKAKWFEMAAVAKDHRRKDY